MTRFHAESWSLFFPSVSLDTPSNTSYVGQMDQIDQIDHDIDHLHPNPPLSCVVHDPYSTDSTQETCPKPCTFAAPPCNMT